MENNMGIRVSKAKIMKNGKYHTAHTITEDFLPIQSISLYLLDKGITGSNKTVRKYAYVIADYLRYLKTLNIHYADVENPRIIINYLYYKLGYNNKILPLEVRTTISAVSQRLSIIQDLYNSLRLRGVMNYNPLVYSEVSKGKKRIKPGAKKKFLYHAIMEMDPAESILSNVRYSDVRHWLKWYSNSEIELIRECLKCQRDRVIFDVSVETGMRIGEILGLKLEDFDRFEKRIKVEKRENNDNDSNQKTGSRYVAISSKLAKYLSEYISGERKEAVSKTYYCEFIFLTKQGPSKGHGMKQHNFLKLLKGAGKRAGFSPNEIRTHSGRSTAIQRIFDAKNKGILTDKIDLNWIENQFGLKEESFKHYRKRPDIEMQKELSEILDKLSPIKQREV